MSDVIENLKPKYSQLFESVLKNTVIRTDISPGDGMFQPKRESYYFETGLDALRNICAALSQARKKPESVRGVLDFACGHGRVARMLRAAFPQAHLTVADTDSKGIAFCAETFQAEPVASTKAVSEIQLDRQYDLIWCGSLLTHLDAPQWDYVLRFFQNHLSRQGIVVFTTHGRYVANRLQQRTKMYNLSEGQVVNLLAAYERDGFGFSPYEDGTQYGISVATPSWVVRKIERCAGFQLVNFVERGWVQHQDIVVCMKEAESDTERYCPICEKSSGRFKAIGRVPREDALCPWCGSLERHRLVWTYFSTLTNLFDKHPKKMLHVAPERCLEAPLRSRLGNGYLTADLFHPGVMLRMNIMDIPYPDETFDVIYCSHVLEHVLDDRKSLREFYRVLKSGGWAIILVPVGAGKTIEDATITDPAERAQLFSQEDHLRRYGPDFVERLREAGFRVRVIAPSDYLGNHEIQRMGLTRAAGEIYYCTKQ